MTSLFQRLGGAPALHAVVDDFYARILADPHVVGFFDDVEMERQKGKQRAFLTWVTGGSDGYTGLDMRVSHARLVRQGLDDSHVDAIVGHLRDTLEGLGVSTPEIDEVIALAESVRDDVLGRASPGGG